MSARSTVWKSHFVICLLMLVLPACSVVNRVKSDVAADQADAAYAKKDYAAAVDGYRQSSEFRGGYGDYMLGWMYADGKGVKRNKTESTRWIQKSADANYPAANFTLGYRKLRGAGERKDPEAAAVYFRKAADGEDEVAMFYLGMMHLKGLGVPADTTESLRWFKMAKAYGYPVHPALLSEAGIESVAKGSARSRSVNSQKTQNYRMMVKDVQTELNRLGHSVGKPDGLAGSKTKAAIKAFQESHGLKVDGKPSKMLLEALEAEK